MSERLRRLLEVLLAKDVISDSDVQFIIEGSESIVVTPESCAAADERLNSILSSVGVENEVELDRLSDAEVRTRYDTPEWI